jgi:hypothetical protein
MNTTASNTTKAPSTKPTTTRTKRSVSPATNSTCSANPKTTIVGSATAAKTLKPASKLIITKGATARGKGSALNATKLTLNESGCLYLALDVHARHCVLGVMREDGTWIGEERCATTAEALTELLSRIQAKECWLTFEEGNMALWLCDVLRPLVSRLIVCDPRENALIGRSAKKRDEWDVRSLCRLMRSVARQIVVFSVDIGFGGPIITGWRQMLMLLIPWLA